MLVPELYASHLAVQPQAGAGVRAWTTGQILEATVVRQALDGTVTLRIGSQEVQARTGLTLAADQPITLQVAQSGVQTVLRVLHASNASVAAEAGAARGGNTPPELATLAHAWRQVLPREGDARPLLARLTSMPPPAAGEGSLPARIAGALQALGARLPALETLFSAAGLKRAIGDSGVFLESRLGQAAARGEAPALAGDYKANLLVLAQSLRAAAPAATPASPAAAGAARPVAAASAALARGGEPGVAALAAVSREADAALARVEQQQLANLGRPAEQPPLWAIEIPLRDGTRHGLLRLQIDADQSGHMGEHGAAPWSVTLDFDLEPLGMLHARVALHGDSVSAALWAEQQTTAELVSRHLDELDTALRAAGLSPTELSCRAGTPPARDPSAGPGAGLVDERA